MAGVKNATRIKWGAVVTLGLLLVSCGKKEEEFQTAGKFIILGTQTDNADRSIAKKNAENTLVRYPDVDAMVGLWAYNAPQCLEALKDADKIGKVKVFSFDEDPASLEGLMGTRLSDEDRETFRDRQLAAQRWTFLGSGMGHPKVRAAFARLGALGRLDAVAARYARPS